MTTSGRPLPAEIPVWNLVYSAPPWPALVQQTWTSLWRLLKLSTTFAMLGYHAQTETAGALLLTILLVQLVSLGLVPEEEFVLPPPLLHAASMAASAIADTAAMMVFFF